MLRALTRYDAVLAGSGTPLGEIAWRRAGPSMPGPGSRGRDGEIRTRGLLLPNWMPHGLPGARQGGRPGASDGQCAAETCRRPRNAVPPYTARSQREGRAECAHPIRSSPISEADCRPVASSPTVGRRSDDLATRYGGIRKSLLSWWLPYTSGNLNPWPSSRTSAMSPRARASRAIPWHPSPSRGRAYAGR